MKRGVGWVLVLMLAAFVVTFTGSCSAQHSWHIDNWYGWSFDYGVYGTAGLELRNVTRNNKLILAKASLPTMRVDYAPLACNNSPFSDLLFWGHLLPRPRVTAPLSVDQNWCGHKVCGRTYSLGNDQWLEIGILGNEGNYEIYQAWYLSNTGEILARVYSKGEQCPNRTHHHHPYWRLDFGGVNKSVFRYEDTEMPGEMPIDEGWGPGFHLYSTETEDVKNAATYRMWMVQDNTDIDHQVWVVPGGGDNSDSFAPRDVEALLYHDGEEGPWTDHAQGDKDIGNYINGEDVSAGHLVLWYVSHFTHQEPLPEYNPNAPCGDPKFPPVFLLRSGEDCNDVLGGGFSLVDVQGPNDASPKTVAQIQPIDYGLSIAHLTGNCSVAAPPGQFEAVLSGVPEWVLQGAQGPSYDWVVNSPGATVVGSTHKQLLRVQLGSRPASLHGSVNRYDLTLTTNLLGIVHSTQAWFLPETEQSGREESLRCLMQKLSEAMINSHVTPGDPAMRNLVSDPYSADELKQIEEIGTRISKEANTLLKDSEGAVH